MNILSCISDIVFKNIGLILIACSIVIAVLIYAYLILIRAIKEIWGIISFKNYFLRA